MLPVRALGSVTLDLSKGAFWTGVYCGYSADKENGNQPCHILEVNDAGLAKIVKVSGKVWADLTPDIPVPEFAKGRVPLRAQCVRDGGQARLAMRVGDHLLAEHTDAEADQAVGKPEFGFCAEGLRDRDTRAYFDDFSIARLS